MNAYQHTWANFDLHIDLEGAYVPPNFPMARNDVSGTLPFLPADAAPARAGQPSRPTDRGVVDLITGNRLLQDVDFELSFGGSVFRHVRTHFDAVRELKDGLTNKLSVCHPGAEQVFRFEDTDTMWDWNGRMWMMSENPIFLMDASPYWNYGAWPACHFVLDAHHSIPFVFDPTAPAGFEYVAPPWFDATLKSIGGTRGPMCCVATTCPTPDPPVPCIPGTGCLDQNGAWCPADKIWISRPTHFELSLNRGSVVYTIAMNYDDVPSSRHLAATDPACVAGMNMETHTGTPYLGLVTNIRDRANNRVEIEYCGPEHRTTQFQISGVPPFACQLDYKSCNQKGQINKVRLVTGSGHVAWTLLYTHRAFGSTCFQINNWSTESLAGEECTLPIVDHPSFGEWDTLHRPHMLHTIHVYEGDVAAPPTCPTLGHARFCDPTMLDPDEGMSVASAVCPDTDNNPYTLPHDLLCVHDHLTHADIPSNWVLEARYLYDELNYGPNTTCPIIHAYWDGAIATSPPPSSAPMSKGAQLLKVTVTRKAATAERSDGTSKYTIYRYPLDSPHPLQFDPQVIAGQGLEVFQDSTIRGVIEGARLYAEHLSQQCDGPPDPSFCEDLEHFSHFQVNQLLGIGLGGMVRYETDPDMEGPEQVELASLVDLYFEGDLEPSAYPPEVNIFGAIISWSGADPLRTAANRARRFLDRREGRGGEGEFYYYSLQQYPAASADAQAANANPQGSLPMLGTAGQQGPAEQHFPFRYITKAGVAEVPNLNRYYRRIAGDAEGGSRPFYIMIIDEALPGVVYNPSTVWVASDLSGVRRRRKVEMNAAGFVLSDKTWSYEKNSQGELISSVGFGDDIQRDCAGRILERRTAGWTAGVSEELGQCGGQGQLPCPQVPGVDKGLIYVFEYDDPCTLVPVTDPVFGGMTECRCGPRDVGDCGPSSGCIWNEDHCECPSEYMTRLHEPIAVGIKKGIGTTAPPGDIRYLRTLEWGISGRPELLTKKKEFPVPTTDKTTPGNETTITYAFQDGDTSKGILEKNVQTPPVADAISGTLRPGIEKTAYTVDGQVLAHGVGSLINPGNSGLYRFFVRVIESDEKGRPVKDTLDASVGLPAGWSRVAPSELPPLNHETHFSYSEAYGLVRQVFPNGHERRLKYIKDNSDTDGNDCPPDATLIWSFEDVYYPEGFAPNPQGEDACGNAAFIAPSPVQITCMDGSRLVWSKTVDLNGTDTCPDGVGAELSFEVISSVTPKYDAGGKVIGVNQVDSQTDGPGIAVDIGYNAWGQPDRSVDASKTVTRQEFDFRGRLMRVYRGTQDDHPNWQRAALPSGDDQCNPDAYARDQFDDDLVLVEKRSYGESVTDADRLSKIRRYRDLPENPYSLQLPPCCFVGFGINGSCLIDEDMPEQLDLSNEDAIGWLEEHRYDWRMRDVWVKHHDESGGILRQSMTWYDNLDRMRYSVEYGPIAPDELHAANPASGAPGQDVPTAGTILATGPISLTEYCYNARGDVEETRTYDVGDATGATYLASRSYHDYAGRKTEVHAPNAPVMRYTYDAKDRQVKSRSVVLSPQGAATELSGTDTVYDADDRAIETVRYDRRHDAIPYPLPATESPLSVANSVLSFTHSWYDKAGRLIAMADFGTNGSAYLNDGPALERVANAPVAYDAGGNITGCGPADTGGALYTCYHFDAAGRQDEVWHADGTVSRQEYDGLGRLLLSIENATGAPQPLSDVATQGPIDPEPELRQVTARKYDDRGRLVKMAAVLPGHAGLSEGVSQWNQINWGAVDGTLQVTEVVYESGGSGAEVIGQSSGLVESENFNFIKEVRFPWGGTGSSSASGPGQPDPDDKFTFRYYSDGMIASRTDQRGIVLTYKYDELGRREEVLIDDSAWYAGFVAGAAPFDRISRIVTTYEATGEPSTVTAYTNNLNGTTSTGVLAQNVYEYDAFRNLTREWQQHFAAADSSSPKIEYVWQHLAAGTGSSGAFRLTEIVYPYASGPLPTERSVLFGYGEAGGVNDRLSRMAGVGSSNKGEFGIAAFAWTGAGRRVGVDFWNSFVQSAIISGAALGYDGLDRFGRVRDLHWTSGGETVLRYQYGYDRAGNRLYARVKHEDQFGTVQDNERSWRFGYDGLSRLVSADTGALDAANSAIVPTAGTASRSIDWSLDNLGNWSGDADEQSVVTHVDTDGDGSVDASTFVHHGVNSANELLGLFSDPDGLGPEAGATTAYLTDPAGNLTHGGQSATSLVYQYDGLNRLVQVNERGGALFGADGKIMGGTLGPLVMAFVCDGQGRVIQKRGLIPPTGQSQGPGFGGHGGIGFGGNPPPNYAEDYYYDGVRRVQDVVTIGTTTTLDREYVYGPGDVNEVLFQFDAQGYVNYLHHDANLNVVALSLDAGVLVEQFSYSPYGELLNVETIGGGTPKNKIGFQGMFFDRLTTQPTQSHMVAGATGLYRTPNRSYSPTLGRWLQRDPNATGQPILDVMPFGGDGLLPGSFAFDVDGRYVDGMSIYQFVSSNPMSGFDPLGLSSAFSWDSEVDDINEEHDAQKLYVVGELNEKAKWASLGLQTTLTLTATILGLDVVESMYLLATGQGGFSAGLDVILSMNPGARILNVLTKAGALVRKARKGLDAADAIHDIAKNVHRFRKGVDPAKLEMAKKLYPKKSKLEQNHHIIPKYLGGAHDGPTVRLNAAYHQLVTNAFRREWPYGQGTPTVEKLKEILERVYGDLPLPR